MYLKVPPTNNPHLFLRKHEENLSKNSSKKQKSSSMLLSHSYNHKNNIIALLLISIPLNLISLNLDSHELPAFVRSWQGIYKAEWIQKGQKVQMAFEVSDNCYANDTDDGMGKFYCEIGYSKMGAPLIIAILIFIQKNLTRWSTLPCVLNLENASSKILFYTKIFSTSTQNKSPLKPGINSLAPSF